jgi:hypothetical protein
MYRRRLAAFAGAIGLLGALFSSGVAARADTAISDAAFSTMVDTYVALATSGQGLCLGVPQSNDGTCPNTLQSSTDKNNVAVCVEHDTVTDESCVIDQTNTSGHNIAIVVQFYGKNQTANQTASITQRNQYGSNLSATVQIAKQSIQSFGTQTVIQKASISQGGTLLANDTGRNLTILHQSSDQFGQSGTVGLQKQVSTEDGHVSQQSTGVSRAHANQSQSQTLKGLGQQIQNIDPRCCATQQDNPNNDFSITQDANQSADNPYSQESSTVGVCDSSGHCGVDQTASINGSTPVRQHCSASSCSIGIACSTGTGCTPCTVVNTEGGPMCSVNTGLRIAAAYGNKAPAFASLGASLANLVRPAQRVPSGALLT